MKIVERLLTDKQVEKRYVRAGSSFGFAVSLIYMGECADFAKRLKRWERWETEYARRGFRTLSIDAFIDNGGYGAPLKDLGEKRVKGEKQVFHAKVYRERHHGKIKPVLNLRALTRPGAKTQRGTYSLPSTED